MTDTHQEIQVGQPWHGKPQLHSEPANGRLTLTERILQRITGRHYHRAIRMTWTKDNSSWAFDPNLLYHCECGATKRAWEVHRKTEWQEPRA